MNIQFMTNEGNGIPTGEKDWRGRERCKYIPNFELMLRNASCEDERKAILEVRDHFDNGLFDGFTFEIVFTAIAPHTDFHTGKHSMEWQVLQHPWYEDAYTGEKWTKEEMRKDIERLAKGL